MKMTRKRGASLVLGLGVFAVLGFTAKPAYLLCQTWLNDRPVEYTVMAGHADDASRMSLAKIAQAWDIPSDRDVAEQQLRALLLDAKSKGVPVSVAGARHSMGGQTIAANGIVVNMLPYNALELDKEKMILHAGSGARWSEIVPFLGKQDCSVAVMQSNNDFTVGGSISVNCHGWQHNQPPIASTVESLRIMTADGTVLQCNRNENTELFRLVLGGYGLFGVILDVDLRVVPNDTYRAEVEIVPYDRYTTRFHEKADGASDVGMVYGRMCVVPGEKTFLRSSILTVFKKVDGKPEGIPDAAKRASRLVYRAQIGSAAGKALRWQAESKLSEGYTGVLVARNHLINDGAIVYQERNADRTDILHEYFVPVAAFAQFLDLCYEIIPRHNGDLLNVTVRNVKTDPDAFLRYADQDMFAFVMLFNQERTPEADAAMQAMTRELIDASLKCRGALLFAVPAACNARAIREGVSTGERVLCVEAKIRSGQTLSERAI
jgi:FAD/FMN-containing dehydrogenase